MKHVYFVRHGQSEGNVRGFFQYGETDLSEEGKTQARHVAERFRTISIDVIISSDYTRARDTAREVADATGANIVTSELFREVKTPSEVYGKSFDDEETVAFYRAFKNLNSHPTERYSDEEILSDIVARAERALAFIEARPEENILVVSHSKYIVSLLSYMVFGTALDDKTFENMVRFFHTSNAGITLAEYDESRDEGVRWRLLTWNDYAHLEKAVN